MRFLSTFVAFAAVAVVQTTLAIDLSRGFSDKIAWVHGLDKAKELAREEDKPIVALIHKTWCGACKALKKDFQAGGAGVDKVVQLSKNYVMVNLEDDESEGKKELEPEGAGYIPRVVFFDSQGNARSDIKSGANPAYAYFYPNAASLGDAMESALGKLKSSARASEL